MTIKFLLKKFLHKRNPKKIAAVIVRSETQRIIDENRNLLDVTLDDRLITFSCRRAVAIPSHPFFVSQAAAPSQPTPDRRTSGTNNASMRCQNEIRRHCRGPDLTSLSSDAV